jgi:4-hydroxysphinganine ceramide fatty acyl 2-hydroxylase
VPLVVFVPVIIYFSYLSLFIQQLTWLHFIAMLPVGLATWTLVEYALHRFVFHYHPTSAWGKTIHFWFHGVHHDYPNDSNRLVMVPTISVPLAIFFYLLFQQVFGEVYVKPFFVGLVTGYLFYDLTHYALHHASFNNKFWITLKNHHMYHHYKDPENGFGVSTTFWDLVFHTTFARGKQASSHQQEVIEPQNQ